MNDPIKSVPPVICAEAKPPLKPEKFPVDRIETVEITLEPGPPAFCGCGKSSAFPFCDGTQNGKRFRQVFYKIAEKRNVWLCKNHPVNYSHREEQISLEA